MKQAEMFDVVQAPKKRRGRRKQNKGWLSVMISKAAPKLGLYGGIEAFNWRLIAEKSEFGAGVQVGPIVIVVAW